MSTDVNNMRFLIRNSLKQYYNNSSNNIEDPIFTGFTFDIDKNHSPLFYMPNDYNEAESLRSANGSNTTLAEKIENTLSKVNQYHIVGSPDTYEINTLAAKDPIGTDNGQLAGYGLQDKYYMDNILYGAVDYIYMVDKVTDGAYTDDMGVSDLGDGTPSSGVYDTYNTTMNNLYADAMKGQIDEEIAPTQHVDIFFDNDQSNIREDQEGSAQRLLNFLKENPDSGVQLNGYASKDNATAQHNMDLSEDRVDTIKDYLVSQGIDPSRITTSFYGDTVQPFDENIMNRAVTCQITGSASPESILDMEIEKRTNDITDADRETHAQNESALNAAEKAYKDAIGEGSEYDTVLKDIADLEQHIKDAQVGVLEEMDDMQSLMNKYLNILRGNGDKTQTIKDVNTVFDNYTAFVETFTDASSFDPEYTEKYKYLKVTLGIPKDEEIQREIDALKLTDEEKQEYGDAFYKIWKVLKSKIKERKVADDVNKMRTDLLKKKEELSKKIFGVYSDGRIGTESNPVEGSLAYVYQQAEEAFKNDNFTRLENSLHEVQDIRANWDSLQKYNEITSEKKTIDKQMPTIDYDKITRQEGESLDAYNARVRNERSGRQTYEVPQTVYDMMGFINGMTKIMREYPYVFQSVTGLDEAYKKYFDMKEPFMGLVDGKITINCLEFLDMRVTSMFNKYFNAVYDRQYKRERVPINLRRFNCSIFVHDIRNFKSTLENSNIAQHGDLSSIVEIALNCFSAVEFKFYDCEILPEETGNLFDNVTNLPNNDMRGTTFTFTYGNCMINFLPFEDLRRYVLENKENKDIKPDVIKTEYDDDQFNEDYLRVTENPIINKRIATAQPVNVDDGNFRRWVDKSELGNVNNNDYREYVRRDSAVAVDDHFKTTIVNNFAMNSVGNKNKELTEMDDALRKIVVGISASTGIPVKGVTDALNIQFIDPILNQKDLDTPVVKEIGNVNNSRVVDTKTMEYIGVVEGKEEQSPDIVRDLGNVEEKK